MASRSNPRHLTARAVLAVITLGAGLLVAATPLAQADDGGTTLLVLGDSVPAGTQQPDPFTAGGFGDVMFDRLQELHGFDKLVNMACPGEDTREMLRGIGGGSEFGSLCYGPFPALPPGGSSQLAVALEYLEDHPGEVGLITLTIGANDVGACAPGAADFDDCFEEATKAANRNLRRILRRLRAAAPGVPIVGMNYYNPSLAYWIDDPAVAKESMPYIRKLNLRLGRAYRAFEVPVANVQAAFKTFNWNGKKYPMNVRSICRFTLMCEKQGSNYVMSDYNPASPGDQTDIHPSVEGHIKIAETFMATIVAGDLLDD